MNEARVLHVLSWHRAGRQASLCTPVQPAQMSPPPPAPNRCLRRAERVHLPRPVRNKSLDCVWGLRVGELFRLRAGAVRAQRALGHTAKTAKTLPKTRLLPGGASAAGHS